MVPPRSSCTRHHAGSTYSFHDTTLCGPADSPGFTIYFIVFVPFSIPVYIFPSCSKFLPALLLFLPPQKCYASPENLSCRRHSRSSSMTAIEFLPKRALSFEFDSASVPPRLTYVPSRPNVLFVGLMRASRTTPTLRRRPQGPHRHARPVPQGSLHSARRDPRHQN